MTFENWIHHANVALQKRYNITISDSGYTDKEFFARFGNQRADEAVEEFATKYDLTPAKH